VADRTRTWSAIWTGAKRRTGPARRHESAPGEAAPERRSERPANAPECRVRAPASESRGATRSRRSGRPGSTRRQRVARPGGSSREVVVAPLPRRREALERSRPQGHRISRQSPQRFVSTRVRGPVPLGGLGGQKQRRTPSRRRSRTRHPRTPRKPVDRASRTAGPLAVARVLPDGFVQHLEQSHLSSPSGTSGFASSGTFDAVAL
jgi:hypothetical protein